MTPKIIVDKRNRAKSIQLLDMFISSKRIKERIPLEATSNTERLMGITKQIYDQLDIGSVHLSIIK